MLMLCWLYCVPFAHFMYYATAPLIIMLSLFIFKRGICRNNLFLRWLALFFIFISCIKIFLIDLQEFANGRLFLKGVFFSLFVLASGVLYTFFNKYGVSYRAKPIKKKDDKELRIWANTSMTTTIILICWELLPWVGYLAVGYAPDIFFIVSWRLIAAFNFVMLVIGFWLSEEYYWFYYKSKEGRKSGVARVWVPSDTLWLMLPLYLLAVAFGIMSDDFLQ